jgi:hypothetical protein
LFQYFWIAMEARGVNALILTHSYVLLSRSLLSTYGM